MGRALVDDPLFVAILPDAEQRISGVPMMMEMFLRKPRHDIRARGGSGRWPTPTRSADTVGPAAQHPSRRRPRMLATVDHGNAVDEHVRNAHGIA
jgi:hypothetical protein